MTLLPEWITDGNAEFMPDGIVRMSTIKLFHTKVLTRYEAGYSVTLADMINPDIVRAYHGKVTASTPNTVTIVFDDLPHACSWQSLDVGAYAVIVSPVKSFDSPVTVQVGP
jgi:hypothetical protein